MLQAVDLTQALSLADYEQQLPALQAELRTLARQIYLKDRPVIVILEGWTAAGKGRVIRRLTQKLDPRGYSVFALSPSSAEERSFHYQRRFWKQIPEAGRIAIFDGSWHRQMVEACGDAAGDEDICKRIYREINQFERQQIDFGALISKFWIHLSRDEQRQRLEARLAQPAHQWKTVPAGQPAENGDIQENAINELILRTSTLGAPWTVVAGDCPRYTELHILTVLADYWREALALQPAKPQKKKKKK